MGKEGNSPPPPSPPPPDDAPSTPWAALVQGCCVRKHAGVSKEKGWGQVRIARLHTPQTQ